jgi:murein DD-endopeptidase MepM/ murein hydrolase activator NlpD
VCPPHYTVNVTANPTTGGHVGGSGSYQPGANVTISATANSGYEFVNWTGYPFAVPFFASQSFIIQGDKNLTANFTPCFNTATGHSVPFGNMVFAPPNSARPLGATFGEGVRTDRHGNLRNHWGIDLGAPVGTPIRAAQSGTITEAISCQPNRVGVSRNYPAGHNGDRRDMGNRIHIDVGNSREVVYWHLQAGNAIAINPRTNVPFTTGDWVNRGEIIGYVGLTGNANINNVPHLHYGVRDQNGTWLDPFNYLNATMDVQGNNYSILVDC